MFLAKFCCKFLAFFQLLNTKNVENNYIDKRLECAAHKRWSKYTTYVQMSIYHWCDGWSYPNIRKKFHCLLLFDHICQFAHNKTSNMVAKQGIYFLMWSTHSGSSLFDHHLWHQFLKYFMLYRKDTEPFISYFHYSLLIQQAISCFVSYSSQDAVIQNFFSSKKLEWTP